MKKTNPVGYAPPLIVAIDIGTSSVRARLYDRLGRPSRGGARRPLAFQTGAGGMVEADPDALLGKVWDCLDELLAQAGPRAGQVAAVATCTFAGSLLGVDSSGAPVFPLLPYSDTRASAEASLLRAQRNERADHQRTGCPFHASYLPARFLWLAHHQPELLRPGVRWLSLGEYMALQLFGETAASYSIASWNGLLDRRRLAWDAPLLEFLPVERAALSSLVDSDFSWQGLRPPFAARWPALAQVPWFPAIGDGATANLGSGCLNAGRVCLTVGTSSAVRVTLPEEPVQVPWGLWCYRVDRLRSLLGGALNEGGNLYAWLLRTLDLPDGLQLEAALAARPPDAHGLTFLPLLAGERSPGWMGSLRGTVAGLSLDTDPLDLLQAGLEGVALRLGLIYRLLRDVLPSDPQIIATGGAITRSPAWLGILADVLGQPLLVFPGGEEASGRGAALLALEALGIQDWKANLAEETAPGNGQVYTPDPARHAVYRRAMQRQDELYDRLRP